MMESSKRPFLEWLCSRFRRAAKRVGESRNAVSFLQSRLMKRILSHFRPPTSAVERKRKQLTWVSLQGQLVGAEEATSSRAVITGRLSLEEAAAWEFFTPLQRVLIVAVVAVAALHLNRRTQIAKLRRQLEIKDEMLSTLQQELDSMKNKEVSVNGFVSSKGKDLSIKGSEDFVQEEIDSMKQKIASLQKEIDNLKDKSFSLHRHRVVPLGASHSSTSEGDWEIYRKQIAAEAELYVQEQEAETRRIKADMDCYVARQAAEAELFKKQKEAEGIKEIADALTKANGHDKTTCMTLKDNLLIQQGNIHGLHPKLSISTKGGREKNSST